MTWKARPAQRYDKTIHISGPLYLEVDYDDVNTSAVDILLPHMLKILNEHWEPPTAWVCRNDDCEEWGRYIAVPINPYCRCGGTLFHESVTESA